MKNSLIILLSFVLVLATSAQQIQPVSKDAAKVKQRVATLAAGSHISVVRRNAPEEFGTFLFAEGDGFAFHDIDTNTDVRLKYEEVRKVKDGYGGYNSVRHRHTDHTRGLVIGAILGAALMGLIVIAASND